MASSELSPDTDTDSDLRRGAIDIAFGCDRTYLQPLAAALASVLATAREPERLRFWLLSRSIRDEDLAALRPVAGPAPAALRVLDISRAGDGVARAPVSGYISEASYYRFLLPELLPLDVRRVIYLDCDLIVCRAIEDLWAEPLDGAALGAVMKPDAETAPAVGLAHPSEYFNAGVLLIDLARWRAGDIAGRALRYALEHPGLKCHDQDALNHVIAGRWRRLDLRWNQQFRFFRHTSGYLGIDPATLRRLRREPFIIHYTTQSKPWHFRNDHPLRERYYAMLDRTIFRGWRPRPRDIRERASRVVRHLVPHYLRPGVLRNVYRPRYHAWRDRWRRRMGGRRT